jgi:hypothetical protein
MLMLSRIWFQTAFPTLTALYIYAGKSTHLFQVLPQSAMLYLEEAACIYERYIQIWYWEVKEELFSLKWRLTICTRPKEIMGNNRAVISDTPQSSEQ